MVHGLKASTPEVGAQASGAPGVGTVVAAALPGGVGVARECLKETLPADPGPQKEPQVSRAVVVLVAGLQVFV